MTGSSSDGACAARSTVRVLIVDDNPGKRLALRAILTQLDYDLVEADSGIAALRCVMAQEFAVILLDVKMPIMNGFETAARIRERRQCEMTPIIFVTAHGRDELTDANLYAQGAVDFITAPVIPDELRAKVSVFANLFRRAEDLAARSRDVQASADQFRLLTDAAPVGIFQTDADDRYVYVNLAWSDLTGIPADAALGTRWSSTLDPKTRDGLAVRLVDTDVHGPPLGPRIEIQVPGRPPRLVVAISRAIPDGAGGIAGRVGTLADVSAEAAAALALSDARDKATEASQLKSDFLANMSHEIRTPMNGVIGMTELLLDTELDPVQRDYALTVRTSGAALLNVINDILDFSKIEAGMLDVESVAFSVRATVQDIVSLLHGPAEAKGLALVPVFAPAVPDVITGDPGRLRQVLMNLVGNAVKFTVSGQITIRISGPEHFGSQGALRFEVADTGIGVPEKKLDGIFQPFVQADTSTSRQYGGTGLGLAISSQLVTLMGGACGASSTIGVGSTFWFTIPVDAEPAPGPPLRSQGDQKGSSPAVEPLVPDEVRRDREATGRLLLAEDNVINQKVAAAILTGAGYQVDIVVNGAEALVALDVGAYDAVLMDCQMPVMSGYEATAAIRAGGHGDRHIPIIAVTAGARAEDRTECMAAGMDGYISKPVRKDALIALVASCVAEVGLRERARSSRVPAVREAQW